MTVTMISENIAHPHCPEERAHLFSAVDGASTEEETQEVLYSLVRSFKPEWVLETGTHFGYGTIMLAKGCRANGMGKVISLEKDEKYVKSAGENIRKAGVSEYVDIVKEKSVEWMKKYDGPSFGFVFLDSDLESRIEELKILKSRKLAMGPVLVHDTSRLRSNGGHRDHPDFPDKLDELGFPSVENPFARGWRLFDLHRPETG